ncbi:ABC transporter ATP-binding protein [Scatolibacter rhodanostii]|uniref:ABC transporter ATP-binding protein n=1 Tax=Scatolibacter rhodanostii TaxID=2014781 RepID=UPI000C076CEE|nr:ABC-F family ATP-binding cassette domain-containing protein [Scatolibacter rhodanostii]
MAILTASNLTKSFGDTTVVENITFEIQKGDRVGLVGVNGSGKTTLFKLLTGEYISDTGGMAYAKETNLGYMEQHVCKDLERTAFDEVMTVFEDLLTLEAELESLTKQLTSSSLAEDEMNALILRQTECNDRFVNEGGLTCRNRAKSTLIGLGFAENQIENPVGILSGGQKAKLQLAKMLLGQANFLLLDEPTNHLDITSVEWLEEFLKNYRGSYIVISHDRYFLDKITDRTFEMAHTHLSCYKGNYSKFLLLKEEKRLTMQREYDARQKEIKRIEGIIEQQKRFNQARNYVTIGSKQKQIDRLSDDLERPENDPKSIRFQFKASRRCGDEALHIKNLALRFDEHQLFEQVSMDIYRGEKVFLIGPNGCGKTSLLKILLGHYLQSEGFVKFGVDVDIGYYQQSQSGLHDEKTVIDEIWDMYPSMTQTEVRSALAIFLFQGEDVFKPIGALSGGERARILLLKLMLSQTNFLLLDEPTNHLDIGSCEALENTLTDYDGTLLVVSHDRYLINKLADKIYYLDKNGATLYLGNYDSFLEQREQEQLSQVEVKPEKAEKQVGYKQKKERDAFLRKQRAALSKCEREIEATDEKLALLSEKMNDPQISSDYEESMRISEEIAQTQAESELLWQTWTELSESLEETD